MWNWRPHERRGAQNCLPAIILTPTPGRFCPHTLWPSSGQLCHSCVLAYHRCAVLVQAAPEQAPLASTTRADGGLIEVFAQPPYTSMTAAEADMVAVQSTPGAPFAWAHDKWISAWVLCCAYGPTKWLPTQQTCTLGVRSIDCQTPCGRQWRFSPSPSAGIHIRWQR